MSPWMEPAVQQAQQLVIHFEGVKLQAYMCSSGVWTIGRGHTRGVYPGQQCTITQADAWLVADLRISAEAVEKSLARLNVNGLNTAQLAALVSLQFNLKVNPLGVKMDGHLTGIATELQRGNWAAVGEELLRWDKADMGGKLQPVMGLSRRRWAEAMMFLGQPWERFKDSRWFVEKIWNRGLSVKQVLERGAQ